jgi:hypothetical protein
MARKGGLGPQGRAAVHRAAETDKQIRASANHVHASGLKSKRTTAEVHDPEQPGSPAATDVTLPNDDETVPPNDSWLEFDSSRVVEGAYDPGSRRIYVRFVKPRGEGTPWVYEGVPQNVWNNFKRSPSPGKFINRTLNGFNNHRGKWGDSE